MFIDATCDPRFHDANRVIINDHRVSEALLYVAIVVYERWDIKGLKALLHHLLDYANTLTSKGKYGYYVRNRMVSMALPHITRLTYSVLKHIEEDFSFLYNILQLMNNNLSILEKLEEKS